MKHEVLRPIAASPYIIGVTITHTITDIITLSPIIDVIMAGIMAVSIMAAGIVVADIVDINKVTVTHRGV